MFVEMTSDERRALMARVRELFPEPTWEIGYLSCYGQWKEDPDEEDRPTPAAIIPETHRPLFFARLKAAGIGIQSSDYSHTVYADGDTAIEGVDYGAYWLNNEGISDRTDDIYNHSWALSHDGDDLDFCECGDPECDRYLRTNKDYNKEGMYIGTPAA